MNPRKKRKNCSDEEKMLSLKLKKEMLDRLHLGESFTSVSHFFNVNQSTVRFIKRPDDKIMDSIASISLSTRNVCDPAIKKN